MPPLRLIIDARMAAYGGIGTYVRHLIPALAASGAVGHCCALGSPTGTFPPGDGTICQPRFPAPIYSLWEQLSFPPNRHGAVLWHSPHFNIPLRWRGALVVTIHDLIHVSAPQYARTPLAKTYAAYMLRQVAQRADAVIAVSEATKQQFCQWTGRDPRWVTVIPHGVPQEFLEPPAPHHAARIFAQHGIRPPFLLWVSAIRPHKNPLMVLRVFARLRQQHHIPHTLVMIGRIPTWYRAPQVEARRLGVEGAVQWLEDVAPEELPAFYYGAAALLMPSYIEGFCFPVLEAMAAGCPVVASSNPAITELIDTAGLTNDPDDVDQWEESLYTVLFNEERRRTCQERGLQRAREFTWARAATQHLAVYRSVLDGGG